MNSTQWDFFMPDTAIEKTEMDKACDALSKTIAGPVRGEAFPSLEVVQVDTDDNGVSFAIALHVADADEYTIDLDVASALRRAAERLERRHEYAAGYRAGRDGLAFRAV